MGKSRPLVLLLPAILVAGFAPQGSNLIDEYRKLEFTAAPAHFHEGWKERTAAEFNVVNSADRDALRAALKDADPLVRAIAARALGIRGDRESADAIAELAKSDPQSSVRMRALESLAWLKAKREVVEAATKDKEFAVKWVARVVVGEYDSDVDYALQVKAAYAAGIKKEAMGAAVVGKPAPDFTSRTLDGKEFKLSEVLGKKPVVIYFSAYDG